MNIIQVDGIGVGLCDLSEDHSRVARVVGVGNKQDFSRFSSCLQVLCATANSSLSRHRSLPTPNMLTQRLANSVHVLVSPS